MRNPFRIDPDTGHQWWTFGWGFETPTAPFKIWLKLGPVSFCRWEWDGDPRSFWELHAFNRLILPRKVRL